MSMRECVVVSTCNCVPDPAIVCRCTCTQTPLTHRLEALRAYLAERLGEATFLRLYRVVVQECELGTTPVSVVAAAVLAAIGKRHATLLPLVFQLMEFENVAFA